MALNPKSISVRPHLAYQGVSLKGQETTLYMMMMSIIELAEAAHHHGDTGLKKDWFGSSGVAKDAEIDQRAGRLHDYLSGLNRFSFRSSNQFPGDIASYSLRPRDSGCESLPVDKLDKNPSIFIQPGFQSSRYSWGEKVCSILHEITHFVLGTKDEKLSDGSDAYGAVKAHALSEEDHAKAYRNADNWAYYFGNYHPLTLHSRMDWRFMTVKEVAARPPLV